MLRRLIGLGVLPYSQKQLALDGKVYRGLYEDRGNIETASYRLGQNLARQVSDASRTEEIVRRPSAIDLNLAHPTLVEKRQEGMRMTTFHVYRRNVLKNTSCLKVVVKVPVEDLRRLERLV